MPPKRTRTTPTAQRDASDLVQLDCKFLIGDRVDDECFVLPAPSLQARKAVISSLKPGFDYLEPNRLTGNCQRPHDCSHEYAVFKAVRVFDPASFARETTKVDANAVESMAIIRCLTRDLIDGSWDEAGTRQVRDRCS